MTHQCGELDQMLGAKLIQGSRRLGAQHVVTGVRYAAAELTPRAKRRRGQKKRAL